MKINYCDSSGLMSICMMGNNFAGQQFCEFSEACSRLNRTKDRYCMHLGKVVDCHCDSPNAQWEARHGISMRAPESLTEDAIFDIRDRNTYPT